MSKIALQGNASGTGTLSIAAPNTNTDYTLTLPAETGTVLTGGGAISVNASAPASSLAIDSSGNITVKDKIQFGVDAQTNIQAAGTSDVDLLIGADTNIRFETATNERFRVGSAGQLGIGGANYGTSGQVLTSAGSGAAPTWSTPSGGKVLQVVQNTYSVETTSTSSTFVSTGLSASITPSSSSSKVLVMAATSGRSGYTNIMTIFRGTVSGTNLGNGDSGMVLLYTGGEIRGQVALQYLDSPATTSSQTYTLAMRSSNGTGIYAQENNGKAVMILMEIAA